MMSSLRKNTATVLWILVFAFIATIIFSWGMGGFKGRIEPGIITKVNGVKITQEQFDQAVQNRYDMERQQTGNEQVSDTRAVQLRNEVWESLVNEILLNQAREDAKVTVSDEELATAVRSMPPTSITSNPVFFDSTGRFNWTLYRQLLADPTYVNAVIQIEQEVRSNLLQQKILRRIGAFDFVSEPEAKEAWLAEKTTAIASYILVPWQDMEADTSDLDEAVLRKAYNDRKEQFAVPAMAKIAYVIMPDVPSRDDSLDASNLAHRLMTRANDGEDFATLARDYSEDVASAEKGGDLGWVPMGKMGPDFDAVAFSAKNPGLYGPILSGDGYHVLKIDKYRGTGDAKEVKASQILIKIERSAETLDDLRLRADGFKEEAREASFKEAASVYKLEVDTLDPVIKGVYNPILENNQAAREFLFNRPTGEISPVYSNRNGLVIFKSLEVKDEGYKPYAEVRRVLVLSEKRYRQEAKAAEVAAAVYDDYLARNDFNAAAAAADLQIRTTPREFTINSFVSSVGRDYVFTSTAFSLEPGEIAQPVKGDRGYFIIRLDSKKAPSDEEWMAAKSEYMTQMSNERQQQVFSEWIKNARENAKITDFRYLYYTSY